MVVLIVIGVAYVNSVLHQCNTDWLALSDTCSSAKGRAFQTRSRVTDSEHRLSALISGVEHCMTGWRPCDRSTHNRLEFELESIKVLSIKWYNHWENEIIFITIFAHIFGKSVESIESIEYQSLTFGRDYVSTDNISVATQLIRDLSSSPVPFTRRTSAPNQINAFHSQTV